MEPKEKPVKKLTLSMMVALCGLLTPMVASAGNGGTGACLIEAPVEDVAFPQGGQQGCFAVCVDGLTQEECQFGKGLEEFFEGQTCGELDVPWTWEGSCQADAEPFGDQCYVIACDGDAELVCEKGAAGTFYPGDLTCGLGVPTMPAFGMAAMVLLILSGALVLLTVRGSLTFR